VGFAIPAAIVLGTAIALTGGASSILFSVAILLVAYFATFGSRIEAAVATGATLLAGLAAVLVNTPVSSTDQTRVLTIFVTVAVLADTVQRSSRMLTVAERRAAELSLVDSLTGLANRTAFERDLLAILPRNAGAPVSREQKLDGPPAVIALDLTEFEAARQRLGHGGSDLLLVEVAEALRDAMDGDGDVYRIGGDEFATIIRSHHMQHVDAIAARCADAVSAIDSDGRYAELGLSVACRIGGSTWESGMTAADLAAAAIARQASSRVTPGFEPVVAG
jgi:diguanylate cyclase (GGDEF)-like protein